MRIPTIIVEDDPKDSDKLKTLLIEAGDIEICAVCTGIEEAIAAIAEFGPSIVFLDIELGAGQNGFDLLRHFETPAFTLIFTTYRLSFEANDLQIALRASAFDFLSKPLQKDKVDEALSRFYSLSKRDIAERFEVLSRNKKLPGGQLGELCIDVSDKQKSVVVSNIVYCQANDNYTYFYILTSPATNPVSQAITGRPTMQKILSSKSIKDWEMILAQTEICRCHKTWMVNLRYEKQLQNNRDGSGLFILLQGNEVPVSKGRKKYVIERRLQFKRNS